MTYRTYIELPILILIECSMVKQKREPNIKFDVQKNKTTFVVLSKTKQKNLLEKIYIVSFYSAII